MTVRDLIDRAYMQVGDTSQVNYTPYQFLEFYNEGNHIPVSYTHLTLPTN